MRKKFAFLIALSFIVPFAASGKTFVEDWSPNPLGSNWYNVGGGSWGVYDSGTGAWLWADNTGDTTFRRQTCYEQMGDNYSYTVRLQIFGAQGTTDPRFGIFSSLFDSYDQNSFTAGIDITGKYVYAIARKNSSIVATAKSAQYPTIDLTQWHDLAIQKSGGQFTVLFDGTPLITLNADLCGGRFGVFAEESHANFWTNQFTDNDTIPCEEKMLFQRFGSRGPAKNGLAIYADNSVPAWRSLHAANASFLKYTDPNDGIEKIYLYFRGTPLVHPYTNLKIGLWTQPASTFDPEGSWEITSNGGPWTDHGVVIGGSEWYDDYDVLDTCAVAATNGDIYIYYFGRDTDNYGANVCVAKSTDGGYTFTKSSNNPLIQDVGPGSAVYHNGKYYIYYIDTKNGTDKMRIYVKVSANPENLTGAETYLCVSPSVVGWDSGNVGGARVFKLDDKWWMIYQAGWTYDYQKRFHAAYSDDLTNWSKVINCKPLFMRGYEASWDQGAIWWGETIQWSNKIYMLYEGWGTNGYTSERDVDYFPEGHSQLGLAIVTTNDFLDWSGIYSPLSSDVRGYWRFEEGTNDTIAPLYWNGDGVKWFKDSSGNGNDMPTWDWFTSPRYTNDIPFDIIPQTGESNKLSCWFGGGNPPSVDDDLWSEGSTFMNNGINFTGGWTVEASVKLMSVSSWQVIVGKDGNPDGGAPLFSIKFNVANQEFECNVYDGVTNNHWLGTGNNSVKIGKWYHIAAICNGCSIRLLMKENNEPFYTEYANATLSGGGMVPIYGNWTIGRGQWAGENADWANAIIDEVRINNKELLPMQLLSVQLPEPGIMVMLFCFLFVKK
ncbi:hypothetical protein KAH27_00890 [bacterium]|nr:hypothetical protein [bacterium]